MKPTNRKLWEELKRKARASTLGSPKGRWSPRKAAAARREYDNARRRVARV